MTLSIIVPVLNEARVLGQTLHRLDNRTAEIIVVDGGSRDATVKTARRYTPHVLVSPKGRGPQQNAGALHATGDVFLFLHADTQLPSGYDRLIDRTLADPNVVFGAFALGFDPPSLPLGVVAFGANLRSLLFKLPYGDQALFVRRSAYFRAGGFRDWPIMEDVDLVRRLNRVGAFRLVRRSVRTSARRWEQERVALTTLKNWNRMIRFFLGVSPQVLAVDYWYQTGAALFNKGTLK